jgi:DNA-binding protein WhiA
MLNMDGGNQMSFSSTVKDEICRHDINTECCLASEFEAIVRTEGAIKIADGKTTLKIITESGSFARRLYTIIRKLFSINPRVIVKKSSRLKGHVSYIIDMTELLVYKEELEKYNLTPGNFAINGVRHSLSTVKQVKECCRRAALRGAFLVGGSISDPEKSYHMEIKCITNAVAEEVCLNMEALNLHGRIIERKGSFIVYLKEGEDLVDFLNIVGAHTALMEFENIRIMKEMRNNVNRVVNCETANLQKTVNASVRQVDNIEYIKKHHGLDKLPETLQEIAQLRLDYPDVNLKELGEMLTPPLGKSGVNHRLRKLDEIAEDMRSRENDI